jgi:hypothetical protein
LRNSGTCAWDAGYTLVCVGGDCMGGPAAVPLPGAVPSGSTVDLSVSLVAPATDGEYTGNWQLRDADGNLFGLGDSGAAFWVKIVVGSPE